jgi:hypothetical protein|nr:MAG TPA: hypothetical protein [Caudoviricetes sp.]
MTIGELVTKAVIERNNIFHIDLANDMEVDITVDKDFTSSDIDKVLEVLNHVDETYDYQILEKLVQGAYIVAKSKLMGNTYMLKRFVKILRIVPFYYDNELRYTVILRDDGREIGFHIDVPMWEVIQYKLESMK